MMRWVTATVVTLSLTRIVSAQAPTPEAMEEAKFAPRPMPTPGALDFPALRDPFRPFILDLRETGKLSEPQTPLQRYDLGQLTVVGILWEVSLPRAMVEDSIGMGYIVTVGTPIGRRSGVVKAIEPDRVVVDERVIDFYGQEQVAEVVMELPSDKGNKPMGRE
jgi:type IV pilus assembly protein PilP